MFDSESPEVYETVYQELVQRLATADLKSAAEGLGLAYGQGRATVDFFGRAYLVGPDGVSTADGGEAAFTHRIVLAWYLLHAGRGEPADRFVPYRELPGGQDFARSLAQTVEGRLAAGFGRRVDELVAAATAIGGQEAGERSPAAADASLYFAALPKVPLLLTFYEADEDFGAEAKVFYDITAPNFLDLECLAVLGLILVLELEAADPAGGGRAAPG